MNDLKHFIQQIKTTPETIEFKDVINIIERYYDYTPGNFSNGTADEKVVNAFSFAKIHQLDEMQTLHCFGHYYREDVLQHPENSDHGNIRAFIKHGWPHVIFESDVLTAKNSD